MKFNEKYKKNLARYKAGKCHSPKEYLWKECGYRIFYYKEEAPCHFCKTKTNWNMSYFDPSKRFRNWHDRGANIVPICSDNEIENVLAEIVMNRVVGNTLRIGHLSQDMNLKRAVKAELKDQKTSTNRWDF
jgi:hypothetical protein